jgi:hypothetical protein
MPYIDVNDLNLNPSAMTVEYSPRIRSMVWDQHQLLYWGYYWDWLFAARQFASLEHHFLRLPWMT